MSPAGLRLSQDLRTLNKAQEFIVFAYVFYSPVCSKAKYIISLYCANVNAGFMLRGVDVEIIN